MTNCKYITKNGRCGLKGSYAYRHGCFGEDMCRCREPMTNADRIRAVTDEELAQWMASKIANLKFLDIEMSGKQLTATEKAALTHDLYVVFGRYMKQPAEEDDMTDCKHEFVYDELHGEIVCKFCGYVLTADDKRELHRKAFELMEDEEGAD